MAIKLTRYYYFKIRNGEPYEIEVSILPKNTTLLTIYVEMTNEQREFYIEHPNATVIQVWNCSMEEPVEPDEPDNPTPEPSDDGMYYYFKLRLGNPYQIKVEDFVINTTIMRMYVEMTAEQKAFYLEHPTASVMEVWNCELTPPYVPPTPDVQEYAAMKAKELKEVCYLSVTVTKLECDTALDKVNNVLADSYYSLTEANSVLSDFRSQSKKALTVINTYTPRILAASTNKEIDSIYNQAVEAL